MNFKQWLKEEWSDWLTDREIGWHNSWIYRATHPKPKVIHSPEYMQIKHDLTAVGIDVGNNLFTIIPEDQPHYKDSIPVLIHWLMNAQEPISVWAMAHLLRHRSAKKAALPALIRAFQRPRMTEPDFETWKGREIRYSYEYHEEWRCTIG
jgi:hypothetical protein